MADLSGINRLAVPSMAGTTPTREDYKKLQDYLVDLTDELKQILGNLDGDNMTSSFNDAIANPFGNKVDGTQNVLSKKAIKKLITQAGDSIRGYAGGNFLMTTGEDGQNNGFMIMDTPDKNTATKAMWLNLKGICYQDVSGEEGAHISSEISDYSTVWSFEQGGFAAEWIVAGALNASLITAGILQDESGEVFYLDLVNGVLRMNPSALSIGGARVVTESEIASIKQSVVSLASGNLLDGDAFENAEEDTTTSIADGVLTLEDVLGYKKVTVPVLPSLYRKLRGGTFDAKAQVKQDNLEWLQSDVYSFVSLNCYVKYTDDTESWFALCASRDYNGEPDLPSEFTTYKRTVQLADKDIQTLEFYIDVSACTGKVLTRSWELSVQEEALSQESVFNALTENGTFKGIFIEDDDLYINASYIKTGNFNADLIKTGAINADLITTGSLSADRIQSGTIDASVVNVENISADNIQAGMLSSEDGQAWFNLDEGVFVSQKLHRVGGATTATRSMLRSSDVYISKEDDVLVKLATDVDDNETFYGYLGLRCEGDDGFPISLNGLEGYIKCRKLQGNNIVCTTLNGRSLGWATLTFSEQSVTVLCAL